MKGTPLSDETRPEDGKYRLGPVKKFFAVVGGADPRILDRAPETAFRFVEISLVLIGTAVVAGLSMVFALTNGLHLALAAAIPLSIVWGLLILNLDRFLTGQMRSTRNVGKLLSMVLPRVLLAAIIGVIVAVPMTIRIFQSEVDAEVARMARAASVNLTEELADSNATKQRDAMSEKVERLKSQAVGGDVPESADDDRVVAVQRKVERAKEDWEAKQEEATQAELLFQCDRYGDETARSKLKDPSKCSPKSGPNGLAAQYEREAKQLLDQANSLKDSYAQAREELSAVEAEVAAGQAATLDLRKQEAEAQLPVALEELRRLEAEVSAEAEAQREKVAGANGMLNQIRALHNLSQDGAMGAAHAAVVALFFVIELLPVIVKAFSAYGDPSLYETIEEAEKKALIQEAKVWRDREIQRVEGEAQRDQAIETDMLEREKALGIEANEFVHTQMRDVVSNSLTRWSEQVQRELMRPTTWQPTDNVWTTPDASGNGPTYQPTDPAAPVSPDVEAVYGPGVTPVVPQTAQRSGLLTSDFVPMNGSDL